MFHSATLKLTGWYLLILMGISFLFSLAIYGIATSELNARLDQLYGRFEQRSGVPQFNPIYTAPYIEFLEEQQEQANHNILISLVYVNLAILVAGGALSYWLARRTLAGIEEVHEAQSRFAGDASHELRTPLAVMKMELEVALRDKKMSTDEMREILASNLEEVDKLAKLSHMLLQLSKAEHGHLEMTAVDLSEAVQSVMRRYDKSGKRVKLDVAKKLPNVHGNEASLEELVSILIDNAIKYSPEDSLVSVRIARRTGRVCLEVINEGDGIPADKLPHIFERFYRVDGSRTNGAKSGYGLGLALAKQIVTIHGGDLSASSAPGQATTMTVLLPIHRDLNLKTSKSRTEKPAGSSDAQRSK